MWLQAIGEPDFHEFYQKSEAITVEKLLNNLASNEPKPSNTDWFAGKLSPIVPEQKNEHLSTFVSSEQIKKFDESGKPDIVQADECTVKFWR